MRAVAANPRVRCKLSGLVTEAGKGWTIDMLRRYVDFLAETFGAQRLMWGSDWPVRESHRHLSKLVCGDRCAYRGVVAGR
jgi:predicted TIM-barrel fold metal-dependent hydrolase